MERNVLLYSTSIDSGHVGLLWFSDDNLLLDETNGEVEFSLKYSVMNKQTIKPQGMHGMYRLNLYAFNRGKVTLVNGVIEIEVGKGCSEDTIKEVIRCFRLQNVPIVVRRTGMYDK